MGVLVEPSAREMFSPVELTAAYEDFVRSGPRYVDAESGIEGSVYRFGTRVLVVYEEPETGVTILFHPTPLADTTKEPYANASDRRRVGMVKNVSALDAYRGGELPLPPGYKIEHSLPVMAAGNNSTMGTMIEILAIRHERGMLRTSYAIHPIA